MNVVADVTKSFPGTVAKVLGKILHGQEVPADNLTVLIYEDQLAELQMAGIETDGLITKPISRTTSVTEVALQLAFEAAANYPATVFFSLHSNVLSLGGMLDAGSRSKVYFCPFSKAREYLKGAIPKHATHTMAEAGTFGARISDQEAFAAIKAALQSKGATSRETAVYQTAVRPLLSSRDARFHKTNPTTSMPSYITALLERAQRAGLVTIEPHSSNPAVWLKMEPQLNPVSAGVPAKVAATSANEPTGGAAAQILSGKGASMRPEELYTSILRDNKMGPFANVRDDLYAQLTKLSTNKWTLDKLVTECLAKAQEAHSEPKESKIPWRTSIRNFLLKLLSRHAVLRDSENNYVVPSFQTAQTIICGIDEKFQDILDGELVLFLLEEGAEITYEDRGSLVGALYMTRDAKYQDRLSSVLTHLNSTGAIQYVAREIKLPLPAGATVTVMPQRAG